MKTKFGGSLLSEAKREAYHSFRNYKIKPNSVDVADLFRKEVFREARSEKLKNHQPAYYNGKRVF